MTREEMREFQQWFNKALKQEPTTKNDLGVDCIPRIEVIDYLCKHCPDDGECFKDCDEIKHLRNIPSVTPQEHRWIPVTERLPEDKQRVLVTRKSGTIGYITWNTWWNEQRSYPIDKVIAWMPLPTPYEPQESEGKE